MTKRKVGEKKRKVKRIKRSECLFKAGDFLNHPVFGHMFCLRVHRYDEIICRKFQGVINDTKQYRVQLTCRIDKCFVNEQEVKPLTIGEISSWRRDLGPGSICAMWIANRIYKSIVLKREEDIVTLQPIGCMYTFKRHIHASSICGYYSDHTPIKLSQKAKSIYLGARCKNILSNVLVRVIDVDVENNMILVDRYSESRYDRSTYNYKWMMFSDFLLQFTVNTLIERPQINVCLGEFDIAYRNNTSMLKYHKDHYDDEVLLRELPLPSYIRDMMNHTQGFYRSFDMNGILTVARNNGEARHIVSNIYRNKISIAINNNISISNMVDEHAFMMERFNCYVRGMRLNQTLNCHRLITVKVASIERHTVRLKVMFHGKPHVTIDSDYRRRTNAYLLNKMMISSLKIVPRHVNKDYYTTVNDIQTDLGLLEYQKIAVSHMIHREVHEKSYLSHSFENRVNGMIYNFITGVSDVDVPHKTGGILQMDVGLGKTVCVIGLYEKRPVKTLVVTPLTLIDQWKTEINKFISCDVTEFYGRKRDDSGGIVLTTYGTVRSLYSCNDYFTQFDRVVFDESHSLKSILSITCQACSSITARYRWCLSATPISNSNWHTLVPQLSMLNVAPYRYSTMKKLYNYIPEELVQYVQKRIENGIIMKYTREGLKHKKLSFHDTIVVEKNVSVELSSEERQLYNALLKRMQTRADSSVSKNYMFLKMLMDKLFLCGSIPHAVPIRFFAECLETSDAHSNTIQEVVNSIGSGAFHKQVKDTLNNLDEQSCCICMDTIERPTITKCLHIYCHECIHQQLKHRKKCPMCRKPIDEASLVEIVKKKRDVVEEGSTIEFYDYVGRRCRMEKNIHQLHQKRPESSKLKKMKEIIDNCSEQIVIFSRFKAVLKSIKDMYPEACLITGATSRKNRKKAIDQFQSGASKIFLLSIHCASVGITLTSGSHMIFMEPVLDKDMRDQAIGRINRTGQSKKIYIHTLMNDTIDLWMYSAFKTYNSRDSDKEKRHFFREETINYLL